MLFSWQIIYNVAGSGVSRKMYHTINYVVSRDLLYLFIIIYMLQYCRPRKQTRNIRVIEYFEKFFFSFAEKRNFDSLSGKNMNCLPNRNYPTQCVLRSFWNLTILGDRAFRGCTLGRFRFSGIHFSGFFFFFSSSALSDYW